MDGESIDLSLLRATVLDASPAEITASLASQRAKAPESRAVAVPPPPHVEVHRSPSPDQPPSPSQGNSLQRDSLNDAQPRSLPDAQKRMTSAGTQRSDRTDPLSQWAYDHTPGQSRSHIAGTTGFRTVPESKTYHTGEWGHVDLDLEPEGNLSRYPDGMETQEVDDLNDLPEDREEPLTELFPQSQRFQQPKTPASISRKRKRNGGADDPSITPKLPVNPFGSSAIKDTAPMRMSQVFEATQAPSSPLPHSLVSDPLSSRPSPNLHHDRPSTAHATSSPARPSEYSRRAITEPHVNWKSQPEYDAQDRDSSPLQTRNVGIVFDDDLVIAPIHERHTALRAERAKASRELRGVHDGRRSEETRRLERPAVSSSIAMTAQNGRRSAIPKTGGLHPTESEEETEHEDESPTKPINATQVPEEVEDFAEYNKENIAEPITNSTPPTNSNTRGDRANKPAATRQELRLEEFADPEPQSGDELPVSSNSPRQDGRRWEGTSSGTTRLKTIADSQRSPRLKNGGGPESTGIAPRSTDDESSRIVCESQTLKETASSPPLGSLAAPNPLDAPRELHAKSDCRKANGTDDEPVAFGSRERDHLYEQAHMVSSKDNSSEFATAQPMHDSAQTPSRNGGAPTTIPETTLAKRMQLRHGAQSARRLHHQSSVHTKGSKRSSQDTGVFHSARSQPKDSINVDSSLTTPGSSQPSSGPAASQPIPLMEVGRRAELASEEDSIQMSPEILQTNDPLYEELMEKHSSPISALRKRRARESATRVAPQKTSGTQPVTNLQNGDNQITSVPVNVDETRNDKIIDSSDVIALSGVRPNARKQVSKPPTLQQPSSSTSGAQSGSEDRTTAKNGNITARHASSNTPLRVFAYFSSSRPGFYPATCLSIANSEPKFKVRFDDDNITQLNSTKVKPLYLQAGDSIRVDIKGLRNINFTVRRCEKGLENGSRDALATDNDGNNNMVVHRPGPSGSAEAPDEVFPIASAYLTNQTWIALKRDFRQEDLATFSATGFCTPSERPSSPTTPNSRSRRPGAKEFTSNHVRTAAPGSGDGLFAQIVFVMTNIDPPSLRDEVAPRITQNGGRVLKEGFEILFSEGADNLPAAQGSRTNQPPLGSSSSLPLLTSSPRSAKPSALHARVEYQRQSVFLLATRHCRHTKYFQALALGIPCLSVRWIEHCLNQGVLRPWQNYLLASGESLFLDGAVVSQSTSFARLSTRYTLQELIDRRQYLLDQQRVVLLNLDDSRTSQLDAHRFLSLALGAIEVYQAASLDEAQDLLEEHNDPDSGQEPWTLVVGSASELIDTTSAAATSSTRSSKRRKGGSRRSDRDREQEDEDAGSRLTQLVEPYPGLRGVSTEFVIQSLIQGRLL